jgi:hypothetical protein
LSSTDGFKAMKNPLKVKGLSAKLAINKKLVARLTPMSPR